MGDVAPRSYEPIPSNGTYRHNPRDIVISSNAGNDSHDPVIEETGNSKQKTHPNCLSFLVMHQFSAEIHKSLIVCFILDSYRSYLELFVCASLRASHCFIRFIIDPLVSVIWRKIIYNNKQHVWWFHYKNDEIMNDTLP